MLKNKKAFLMAETTVKIVIAIIGIGILVYLGFKLYSLTDLTEDIDPAEGNLNKILAIIDDLEKKGGGVAEYNLLSPTNWMLIGWPNDLSAIISTSGGTGGASTSIKPYGDKIPNECTKNGWSKCICICSYSSTFALDSCNDEGFCRELNYDFFINEEGSDERKSIKIGNGREISIKLENDVLTIN